MAPDSIIWRTPFGERFNTEVDLAELAGTAGLLLVPVVAFRLAGDALPVGDARWMGVDFGVVAALHFFEDDA